MKSWKAWLLVAVIFITGALAGAFGMRAYMAWNLPELLADTRKRLEEHFLEVIDREVGLSEKQKQSILPILKASVEKMDKIHASVRDQMDAVRQDADDRIAGELDAAQRVKFAEFRARMEKFQREGPRRGGPGGPMPSGPPGFPPGPPPPGAMPGLPPGPPPGGEGAPGGMPSGSPAR